MAGTSKIKKTFGKYEKLRIHVFIFINVSTKAIHVLLLQYH